MRMRFWLAVLCALAAGFVVGRFTVEPEGDESAADLPRELHRKSGHRNSSRVQTGITSTTRAADEFTPPLDAEPLDFFQWLEAMNAGNWRGYLDALFENPDTALSFLGSGSPEAIGFLQRVGAVGGADAAELICKQGYEAFLARVVQGWASVAPSAAFAWVGNRRGEERHSEAWSDASTYAAAELSRAGFKAIADPFMGRAERPSYGIPDNKLLIEELVRIHGWEETERLLIEHVFKQDESNDQAEPGIWRGGQLWGDWQQAYRNRLARIHPENVLQHYVQWLREYSALPLEERLDRHLGKVIGHIESQIEEQSSR